MFEEPVYGIRNGLEFFLNASDDVEIDGLITNSTPNAIICQREMADLESHFFKPRITFLT